MSELNRPDHYLIGRKIDTKEILDLILNSDELKKYQLTPSQIFDFANILKYRLRAGKKEIATIGDDIGKVLDYEKRLANSFDERIEEDSDGRD